MNVCVHDSVNQLYLSDSVQLLEINQKILPMSTFKTIYNIAVEIIQ